MVPNPGCRLALVQCASWTRRCALGAPARLGAHSALHPHLSRDRAATAAAAARARSAERTRRTLCGRKPRQPELTHTHPRTHALKASRETSVLARIRPPPLPGGGACVRPAGSSAPLRSHGSYRRFFFFFLFSSWFLSVFYFPPTTPSPPQEEEQFPVESGPFPGMWMNYWRVVNKCEKKAEARGSASALRPGKRRLSQSGGR